MQVSFNFTSSYNWLEYDKESESSCFSIFNKIGNHAKNLASHIADKALSIFKSLGQIRSDSSAFARSLRLCNYAFLGIEYFINKPGFFAAFSGRFVQTDNFIDTINIFEGVSYIVTGKYNNDNLAAILGWASFGVAGIIGVFLFLDELAIISLASISAGIGSSHIFGAMAYVGLSLGEIALGFVTVAYACFAVSAVIRLLQAETPQDKKQAWLDLAWSIAEVALKIFIFSGCTAAIAGVSIPVWASTVGLVALGTVATVLGLKSFLYAKNNEAKAQQ